MNIKVSDAMRGVQVGAASFADEGVEQVLDVFQQRAEANTVFLTTFTHGRGLAGRQVPGYVFPDHGPRESDEKIFHGGNYATPHEEFYRNTILKVPHAPDLGELDILKAVLGPAKKRGMKVICGIEDQWRSDIPGIDECREIDLEGKKGTTLCLLNPN